MSVSRRRYIFFLLVLGATLLYVDMGSLPASLICFTTLPFNLSLAAVGWLGGLPYVGLVIAAPLWASLLQKQKCGRYVAFGILFNILALVLFATSAEFVETQRSLATVLLFFTRLLTGMTQAGYVIFAPLWVNSFAPLRRSTTWLGILQSAVAVGILLGYAITGAVTPQPPSNDWKLVFYAQACSILPIFLALISLPHSSLDFNRVDHQSNRDFEGNLKFIDEVLNTSIITQLSVLTETSFSQFRQLFSNSLWVYCVLALCDVFFIVSGMLFWMTAWLQQKYKENASIHRDYIIIALVPVAGVILGGFLFDSKYIGGYKTRRGQYHSMFVSFVIAFICFCVGSILPTLPDDSLHYYVVVSCTGLILFLGAIIMSPCTGMILQIVPIKMQSMSSAVSMAMYNILGYSLASVLPGIVAVMKSESSLSLGMQAIYSSAGLGTFFLFLATWTTRKRYKEELEWWRGTGMNYEIK